jgi:hypothetical protein
MKYRHGKLVPNNNIISVVGTFGTGVSTDNSVTITVKVNVPCATP